MPIDKIRRVLTYAPNSVTIKATSQIRTNIDKGKVVPPLLLVLLQLITANISMGIHRVKLYITS